MTGLVMLHPDVIDGPITYELEFHALQEFG